MSQTECGQIGEVSKEFWEIVGLVLADGSIRMFPRKAGMVWN